MVISDSNFGEDFVLISYPSTDLKSYIYFKVDDCDKKVAFGEFHVSLSCLPNLLKFAKTTKFHANIVYDNLTGEKARAVVRSVLNPNRRFLVTQAPTDYSLLHLTDDAPPYIVDAAYKALVAKTHPDVGGSPERFMEIQQAYERVKKARNSS
jgi:hypothetical protein